MSHTIRYMLTIAEVASRLGQNRGAVRRWIRTGRLPARTRLHLALGRPNLMHEADLILSVVAHPDHRAHDPLPGRKHFSGETQSSTFRPPLLRRAWRRALSKCWRAASGGAWTGDARGARNPLRRVRCGYWPDTSQCSACARKRRATYIYGAI